MIALIPQEGVGLLLLFISLVCHGSWSSFLDFCPLEDSSSSATIAASSTLQRAVYHRNVFSMHLDMANSFFLVSMMPFVIAMILAVKSTDVLAGGLNVRLGAFAMLGGFLLGFGHLTTQWSTGVYGPALPVTQAIQASLTLLFAVLANYQLQPALTHSTDFLFGGFLCYVVGIIAFSLARREVYIKQFKTIDHESTEPQNLLEKKSANKDFNESMASTVAMTMMEDSNSNISLDMGDWDRPKARKSGGGHNLQDSESSMSMSELKSPRIKLKKNSRRGSTSTLPPLVEEESNDDPLQDESFTTKKKSLSKDKKGNRNEQLSEDQTGGILGMSGMSNSEFSITEFDEGSHVVKECPPQVQNIQRRQTCPEIIIAVTSGLAFGFTSAFFNIALNDPFRWSDHKWEKTSDILSVARTQLFFAFGFWLTSIVGNLIRLHADHPRDSEGRSGVRKAITDYVTKESFSDREKFAIIAGSVFAIGIMLQFQAGKMLGYTTAEMVQAYPVVSTMWTLNWFHPVDTSRRSFLFDMYVLMYFAYITGIVFLILSRMVAGD